MGVMNKIMGFLGLDQDEYVEEVVEEREAEEQYPRRNTFPRANNVVSLQVAREREGLRLMLFEPRHYSDAQDIADNLRQRRPVVVNLQRVDKEQAKRIVDFLSGTVYALNGDIQKAGEHIFVCTPDHIDIQGSISSAADES